MPIIRCPLVCKTIAIPGKFNKSTGVHGTPTAAELCKPKCPKGPTRPGGPRQDLVLTYPGGPLVCRDGDTLDGVVVFINNNES